MPAPELWIIAGPNGAGKTTTVSHPRFSKLLPGGHFVNPDTLTLQYLNLAGIQTWREAPPQILKDTFIRAANDCEQKIHCLLEDGQSVIVETVLSTSKYCPLVEKVRGMGGKVFLIYVALQSPELSARRVEDRVKSGGHGVPAEKLPARWKKSLEMLPWFAFHSSAFWILDNSSSAPEEPARLLVSTRENFIHFHGVPPPGMRPVISDFLVRLCSLNAGGRWKLDITDACLFPPDSHS